jgi:hypothetical protein
MEQAARCCVLPCNCNLRYYGAFELVSESRAADVGGPTCELLHEPASARRCQRRRIPRPRSPTRVALGPNTSPGLHTCLRSDAREHLATCTGPCSTSNLIFCSLQIHRARPKRNFSDKFTRKPRCIMGELPIEEAPFPLTDVDRWVLSQTDEEFKRHDWDELRTIIGMLSELPDTIALSIPRVSTSQPSLTSQQRPTTCPS